MQRLQNDFVTSAVTPSKAFNSLDALARGARALPPSEQRELFIKCGDDMCRKGELSLAVRLYAAVEPTAIQEQAGQQSVETACQAARTAYGSALCMLQRAAAKDPTARRSDAVELLLSALAKARDGLQKLMELPADTRERTHALVLSGSRLLLPACEALTAAGRAVTAVPFLTYALLAVEACSALCTTRHLPWRVRLYSACCRALGDAGDFAAAAAAANRGIAQVEQLRAKESANGVLPPPVEEALSTAERDLRLLAFKYTTIASAASGSSSNADAQVSSEQLARLLEEKFAKPQERWQALLDLTTGHEASAADQVVQRSLSGAVAALLARCVLEPADNNAFNVLPPDESDSGVRCRALLMRELMRMGQASAVGAAVTASCTKLATATSLSEPEREALALELLLLHSATELPAWDVAAPPMSPGSADESAIQEPPAGRVKNVTRTEKRRSRLGKDLTPQELTGGKVEERAEYTIMPAAAPGKPSRRVRLDLLHTAARYLRAAACGDEGAALVRESRPAAVLKAADCVWRACQELYEALEALPAEAPADAAQQASLLESLEALNICWSSVPSGDAHKEATTALQLALLLADWKGDRRKAVQVLRGALARLDRERATLAEVSDSAGSADDAGATLASITASFNLHAFAAAAAGQENQEARDNPGNRKLKEQQQQRLGGLGPVARASAPLPALRQFLAAVHTDLVATLFRVELELAVAVRARMRRHLAMLQARAAAKAKAAVTPASKKKKTRPSDGMIGGDSSTAALEELNASSPAAAESSVPSLLSGMGNGELRSHLAPAALAVSGLTRLGACNAAAITAGATIAPEVAHATLGEDESGLLDGTLLHAAEERSSLALTRHTGKEESKGCDSSSDVRCTATESRLLAETLHNPYQRALLLAATARFVADAGERSAVLRSACDALKEARRQEDDLVAMADALNNNSGGKQLASKNARKAVLPAPALVSRSSMAIVVRPCRSTTPQGGTIKAPEQQQLTAQVCVYAKTYGAGTGVTLNNNSLPGTGVPICCDASREEGAADAAAAPFSGDISLPPNRQTTATVTGLEPNERYIFALAAVDGEGRTCGGIGTSSVAVGALNPLPLLLCWAYVGRAATALGCPEAAALAAAELFSAFASADSSGTAFDWSRHSTVNPLHALRLRPLLLSRSGAAVLQAFVQVTLAAAEAQNSPASAIAIAALHQSAENAVVSTELALSMVVKALVAAKRMLMALEAAAVLKDYDLVLLCAWKSYHALLPVLGNANLPPAAILFPALSALLAALRTVPAQRLDASLRKLVAAVAYHLAQTASDLPGEEAAVRTAILDAGFAPQDAQSAGEHSGGGWQAVPEQCAALELWLADFPLKTKEQNPELWQLRRALALSKPTDGGDNSLDKVEAEDALVVASFGEQALVEAVGSVLVREPGRALRLLQERQNSEAGLVTPPPLCVPRLACSALRAALRRGSAAQALRWMSGTTAARNALGHTFRGDLQVLLGGVDAAAASGSSSKAPDAKAVAAAAVGKNAAASAPTTEPEGVFTLFRASQIAPAALAVLNAERALEGERTLYIMRDVDGSSAVTPPAKMEESGENAGTGDNKEVEAMPNEAAAAAAAHHLLWLSEVEAILGAASMQRALALLETPAPAARGSRAAAEDAAGPFARVSSTMDSSPLQESLLPPRDAWGACMQALDCEGTDWPAWAEGPSEVLITGNRNRSPAMLHYFTDGLWRLAVAADRARRAGAWRKVRNACASLWNAIVGVWLSPREFGGAAEIATVSASADGAAQVPSVDSESRSQPLPLLSSAHASLIMAAAEALMDCMEAAATASGVVGEFGTAAMPEPQWSTDFVLFALDALYCCRSWGPLARGATRLMEVVTAAAAHFPPALHASCIARALSLGVYAQKLLCESAAALEKACERELAAAAAEVEAAGAEAPSQQLQLSGEPANEEAAPPTARQLARQPLVEALSGATARRRAHDQRLAVLMSSQGTAVYANNPTGSSSRPGQPAPLVPASPAQMLTEVRSSLLVYMARRHAHWAGTSSLGSSIGGGQSALSPETNGTTAAFDDFEAAQTLVAAYTKVAAVLRQKRERELLVRALSDLGDLHAANGRMDAAAAAWSGAVDALCSALNAPNRWRQLFATARVSSAKNGSGGSLHAAYGDWSCFAGAVLLAKVSRSDACATQLKRQRELCLMGAALAAGVFEDRLPHPQSAADFATYVPPRQWRPKLGELQAAAVAAALEHIAEVLLATERPLAALPLFSLLEFLCLYTLRDRKRLAAARILRCECLTKAGKSAEALASLASTIAFANGCETGLTSVAADELRHAASAPIDLLRTGVLEGLVVGYAPFHNHLPFDAPENAAAVAWLQGQSGAEPPAEEANAAGGKAAKAPANAPGKAAAAATGKGKAGAPDKGGAASVNAAALAGAGDAALDSAAMRAVTACPRGTCGLNGASAAEALGEELVLRLVSARAGLLADLGRCNAVDPLMEANESGGSSATAGAADPTATGTFGGHAAAGRIRDGADGMLAELQLALTAAAATTGPCRGQCGWIDAALARCEQARARVALAGGKLRVARHHATRALAILVRHEAAGKQEQRRSPQQQSRKSIVLKKRLATRTSSLAVKADAPGASGLPVAQDEQRFETWAFSRLWLGSRHDLAACALSQDRQDDAVMQCERGLAEAAAKGEETVAPNLRRMLAQALVLRGELPAALEECERAVEELRACNGGLTMSPPTTKRGICNISAGSGSDLAAALLVLARLRIAAGAEGEGSSSSSSGDSALLEAARLLAEAVRALQAEADEAGWLGVGSLTFEAVTTNLMGSDSRPPLLHALQRQAPLPGAVPSDCTDVTAPTPLANLHFPWLRRALVVRIELTDILLRLGGSVPPPPPASDDAHDDERNSKSENGDVGVPSAAEMAEETIAIMRHVAHPAPALRAKALLQLGQARVIAAKSCVEKGQTCAAAREALWAAVHVAFWRGGHDRRLMADACRQIAGLEVNHQNGKPVSSEAVRCLMLAARLQGLQRFAERDAAAAAPTGPLPPAALAALPRSALDELAGVTLRSEGDGTKTLTAPALLRFFFTLQAAASSSSAAAANPLQPADAGSVSQLHAVLYRHLPAYREQCCLDASALSLAPATELKPPADTICVQWLPLSGGGSSSSIGREETLPAAGAAAAASAIAAAGGVRISGLLLLGTASLLAPAAPTTSSTQKQGQAAAGAARAPAPAAAFGAEPIVLQLECTIAQLAPLLKSAGGLASAARRLQAEGFPPTPDLRRRTEEFLEGFCAYLSSAVDTAAAVSGAEAQADRAAEIGKLAAAQDLLPLLRACQGIVDVRSGLLVNDAALRKLIGSAVLRTNE